MTPQRASAVETAFGSRAVVVELWGQGDPDEIAPEEWPLVEQAVENRVRQFAAGRQCARAALGALGVTPRPLIRSNEPAGRGPVWPAETYGTISHTDGYAVAAASTKAGPSIGIDAERIGRVTEQLFERLFVPSERSLLAGLDPTERAVMATVLFGLKECFYKAQFPLTGAWVGFHDVVIEPAGDAPFIEDAQSTEGAERAGDVSGGPGWVLRPATGLAALDAVVWPCRGWSLRRPGPDGDLALTFVEAEPSAPTGR